MESTKILLDYHRRMLDDAVRTEAFRRAIAAVVRPGDAVVDVGTGTGILACFACAAGARRVYAIEVGQIVEMARATVAENGWADRVTFLPRDSRRVEVPERADVVVSETLGGMGVEENIVEIMADARRRFLKPGGRLIPSRVQVFVAPASVEETYARLTWPSAERCGVRFSLMRHLSLNTPHRVWLSPSALLGPPVSLYDLDLGTADRLPERTSLELPADREGVCHGVAAWFSAYDGNELLVSNSPDRPSTHWGQMFLPVAEPCRLEAGGRLALSVRVFPTRNEIFFEWSGAFFPVKGHDSAPGPSFTHSNLHLVPPWQGLDLATKQAIAAAARRGSKLLAVLTSLNLRRSSTATPTRNE
ncbi:MAG: 50S ribosomal protein L11 methyltransferase [Bacillota bacterium]|nr:50S ribosomal protein L11 methyltransferase [Bacillota bacterium]